MIGIGTPLVPYIPTSVPMEKNDMADKQSVQSTTMLGNLDHNAAQPTIDELKPDYIEERFRVDRKKLEQMLQGSVQ